MFKMDETYYRIGQVKFDTIQDVKRFVNFVGSFTEEYNLISGRYIIDAKSIMGIFSLDLSKPVIIASTREDNEDFKKEFEAQNFKKE